MVLIGVIMAIGLCFHFGQVRGAEKAIKIHTEPWKGTIGGKGGYTDVHTILSSGALVTGGRRCGRYYVREGGPLRADAAHGRAGGGGDGYCPARPRLAADGGGHWWHATDLRGNFASPGLYRVVRHDRLLRR